ncbi:C39 family peptidase [Streptomyces sp. NPDC048639]|uniref:C39 family peptidase n=1 Tax=Streptomyces sp. NPDC048639 TaxID=3365581 RepID=UPI003712F9CB
MTDSPTVIHPVPYYAQWESPGLVPAIIAGTTHASDDPLWPKSGAADAAEYAFWSWRICGMACLRMALDHWGHDVPPAVSLAEEFTDAGAYVRHADRVDGLIHAPFAAHVRQRWGLFAASRPELPARDLPAHLRAGRLVVLSVHPSVRDLAPDPPGRGGHLVLAVGVTPEAVVIHNPSGFPGRSQAFAQVPWADLDRFYAARGIVLGPAV